MKLFLRGSFSFLCIFLSLLISSTAYAELKEQTYYRVSKVIDGDTIRLQNGEYVRLIGIDTPEMKNNAKLKKDIKKQKVSKAAELKRGRQAYLFTQRLVEGKKVHLKFDKKKYDNYHRTLAYVYLGDGMFVNAQIVKEGYAYLSPIKPDLRHAPLFRRLYNQARQQKRGLWKEAGKGEHVSSKRVKWFKN